MNLTDFDRHPGWRVTEGYAWAEREPACNLFSSHDHPGFWRFSAAHSLGISQPLSGLQVAVLLAVSPEEACKLMEGNRASE